MKRLVAFDLDGTLAASKQAIDADMAELIADLLDVALVAVISGGDWPQFEKQVVGRLPERAKRERLYIMPTTGTKLYQFRDGAWHQIYADVFKSEERDRIVAALNAVADAQGLNQGQTWGERIEDRGSQVTFSALGQEAPLDAKEHWDSDRAKRTKMQAQLREKLPGLAINIGGSTSIDITREGVDKAYGLRKLSDVAGVPHSEMLFVGDAIYPGGNDYPAHEMGLDTIRVASPDETRAMIRTSVAVLR